MAGDRVIVAVTVKFDVSWRHGEGTLFGRATLHGERQPLDLESRFLERTGFTPRARGAFFEVDAVRSGRGASSDLEGAAFPGLDRGGFKGKRYPD